MDITETDTTRAESDKANDTAADREDLANTRSRKQKKGQSKFWANPSFLDATI